MSKPLKAERTGARLREDVARVTQEIADELAGLIRRAPEQWHVFSDPFAEFAQRIENERRLVAAKVTE